MKTSALVLLAVFLTAALAEAKIEPKPMEAEQNFNLLKQTSEDDKDLLLDDYVEEEEGSGDDDYDYDEELYDEDEDYYEDELEEGSGDHDLAATDEDHGNLIPDAANTEDNTISRNSDFSFDDDHNNKDKEMTVDDLLGEYYDDQLYGDEDEDEEYLYTDDDLILDGNDGNVRVSETVITVHQAPTDPNGSTPEVLLQPSYIFLMLASALISFAFFTLMFILCRRSIAERRKKAAMVPFSVSSVVSSRPISTPIVKNYQRVPTSTKEMLAQQQQQQQQHTSLEITGKSETQKPLLT